MVSPHQNTASMGLGGFKQRRDENGAMESQQDIGPVVSEGPLVVFHDGKLKI